MLIFGRAYLYIEYTMGGAVLNLWPLDARITYPVTDGHGEITGHVQNYQGKIEEFGTDEVIFFPLVTSGSEVEGLSPLETLLDSIAMEINAEKFNAMLFENNLNVGAIISLPDATEEQAQEAQDYLERKYSTPANAHRPLILRQKAELVKDGAAKINDIGWEKLIEVSRQKVCAVYGVPEHNLGISKNSNKASGLSHDRAFWTDTVQPLVSMAYGHVTHQFIRGAWQSASLYLLEPLQAVLPTGEEIDAALKIAQVGATYNYIRQLVSMEPVPNGDVYVIWTPGG